MSLFAVFVCQCLTSVLSCSDCNKFGRNQQLEILRAVYQLSGNRLLPLLQDKYDIDITGV